MANPQLMDVEAELNRGTLALACLARMHWSGPPNETVDLDREELGALFEVLKAQNQRAEALLAEIQRAQIPPQL